MLRYLKNQNGETIVEVIVSFVLLLMFTALFVVSLRYARTMSLKAETIRQTAYAQCEQLYPAGDGKPQWVNDGSTASYTFTGTGAQFVVGNVQKQKLEAKTSQDGTDESYTFHRYRKGQSNTSGGQGTP